MYYGIIINNGTLTQLDATVNASFSVDGVTIFAKNLDFDYSYNINTTTSLFTLTGMPESICPPISAMSRRPSAQMAIPVW